MNTNEVKSRKDYYGKEFNSTRANDMLMQLIAKCSFKEICWIFRSIAYDMVAYYDQNAKAKIYDGTHSELNIEQANRLQQQISSLVDLFEQSIVDKREFNEGYLKDYEFARLYIRMLNEKNERIKTLEDAIAELNSKV